MTWTPDIKYLLQRLTEVDRTMQLQRRGQHMQENQFHLHPKSQVSLLSTRRPKTKYSESLDSTMVILRLRMSLALL